MGDGTTHDAGTEIKSASSSNCGEAFILPHHRLKQLVLFINI